MPAAAGEDVGVTPEPCNIKMFGACVAVGKSASSKRSPPERKVGDLDGAFDW